ncbi:MAG TPA: hypothetical protein VGP47_01605, partial [Parachlamydiaceae bacterium]|nr:hypothetical protein [Parachlamydiaceae bacterium]
RRSECCFRKMNKEIRARAQARAQAREIMHKRGFQAWTIGKLFRKMNKEIRARARAQAQARAREIMPKRGFYAFRMGMSLLTMQAGPAKDLTYSEKIHCTKKRRIFILPHSFNRTLRIDEFKQSEK